MAVLGIVAVGRSIWQQQQLLFGVEACALLKHTHLAHVQEVLLLLTDKLGVFVTFHVQCCAVAQHT
jgi:hypothetical protein